MYLTDVDVCCWCVMLSCDRVGPGEASLVTACQVLCASNGGPSHVPGGAWRAVCVRGDSSVVLGAVLYGRETGVLHHVAVLQGYRTRHIGRYISGDGTRSRAIEEGRAQGRLVIVIVLSLSQFYVLSLYLMYVCAAGCWCRVWWTR